MAQNKAERIAKEQGFSCAECVGEWRGNKVYIPYNPPKNGTIPPIEKPLVILQSGDEYRVSTANEALTCFLDLSLFVIR